MRDEDDRRVQAHEVALEPLERGDVEVVGRLVEQQQVGIAGERARERGARQLAAREAGEAAVELGHRRSPARAAGAIARARQFQPPACSSRPCARA